MRQSKAQQRKVKAILRFLYKNEYESGYLESDDSFLKIHRCDMLDEEGFGLAISRKGIVHACGHGCFTTPFRMHSTESLGKMLQAAKAIANKKAA
jgi:hypothetical protein